MSTQDPRPDADKLRSLEQALAETESFSDEDLDLYNAFDPGRFRERAAELIDGHPEAAELRRNIQVPEDQPLDKPVVGEANISVPRGLSLRDWARSSLDRHEDPVELCVWKSSEALLHVGVIRPEEVRRQLNASG
jgi:hypothetical protein